jgi:hypothetical protein
LYVEERLDGESIGLEAGCSGTTVLDIVRAAGHPIRPPGRGVPRPRLISDEDIARRYKAGEDGPRLAQAAGCTPGTIYRLLRLQGVYVRPPPSGNRQRAKPDNRDG